MFGRFRVKNRLIQNGRWIQIAQRSLLVGARIDAVSYFGTTSAGFVGSRQIKLKAGHRPIAIGCTSPGSNAHLRLKTSFPPTNVISTRAVGISSTGTERMSFESTAGWRGLSAAWPRNLCYSANHSEGRGSTRQRGPEIRPCSFDDAIGVDYHSCGSSYERTGCFSNKISILRGHAALRPRHPSISASHRPGGHVLGGFEPPTTLGHQRVGRVEKVRLLASYVS